jgi:hypothetical protein
MPANRAWPGIPGDFDAAKKMEAELELFKAQLEIQKAKDQSSIDREKTEAQNNFDRSKDEFSYYYAMLQAINTGFIDVAKGAIDRSIQRADFVQKVATALGTIYSGVLAYSLSVDKEKHLTFSGMLPVVFLGLAFVFSAFYVSFITRSKDIEIEESDGTLPGEIHSQLNTFIAWATAPVMERRAFLHSSIISLGFGILFCLILVWPKIR